MSTNRRSSLPARALAAVAVAGIAVLVSACDAEEVGTAAVVGDERYTISELQGDVEEIASIPGSALDLDADLTEIQTQLITEQVQAVIFDRLAQEEDIEVTEASIDSYIDEQVAPQADGDLDALLAQNNFTRERLRPSVRIQLIANELFRAYGEDSQALDEAIAATADEIGVDINPRYGEWEGIQLNPEVSGSVSVPEGGETQAATNP